MLENALASPVAYPITLTSLAAGLSLRLEGVFPKKMQKLFPGG